MLPTQPQPPLELLFDLDGTLTDPFTGITNCLRHALTTLGREPVEAESLRACIGLPLRESFRTLLETDDPAVVEPAVAAYRERYFTTGLFENALYDDVDAMLGALAARGHRLRVVTSKVVPAAVRIIDHFGLDRHFASIHGSELDGRFDDKRELLAHVLAAQAIDPSRAVMIGDRRHDIDAGRRNGVRTVGVTWGYGSEGELRDAGADVICTAPAELVGVVEELTRMAGAPGPW